MPPFHQKLLAEGRTKLEAEEVRTQALRLDKYSDYQGLIYVYPELVTDIKDFNYELAWDTSYKNCHRRLYTFVVSLMYLYHQKERREYHDRLKNASTTIVGDIEKGEGKDNTDPGDYHGLMQVLSSYIYMFATVVGIRSTHTQEVVAIRKNEDKDGPLCEY